MLTSQQKNYWMILTAVTSMLVFISSQSLPKSIPLFIAISTFFLLVFLLIRNEGRKTAFSFAAEALSLALLCFFATMGLSLATEIGSAANEIFVFLGMAVYVALAFRLQRQLDSI